MPANIVKSTTDEDKRFKEGSLERVVTRYKDQQAARRVRLAYEEGKKDEDGWGWDPNTVPQGNEFRGEGSVVPPARDGMGQREVKPEIPKGTGVDAMLSRSEIPRFASKQGTGRGRL